jgi:hypothetical protein
MRHHLRGSAIFYRVLLLLTASILVQSCALTQSLSKATVTAATPVKARTAQEAVLQAARGTVEVQAQGKWVPASSTGESTYLSAGQHVRTGSLSSVQIGFFDGSLVSLDPESELSIDKLDAQTGDQPRQITLTQVSGSSQHSAVTATATGSLYAVKTPAGTGTAKGTEFSVRVLPNKSATFSVAKGEVSIAVGKNAVTVGAGQMTSIAAKKAPLPPAAYLSGEGVVTQSGKSWTIGGQTYQTQANTLVLGSINTRDVVHFEAHSLKDGSRMLDLVSLLQPTQTNHFRLQGTVEAIADSAWTVSKKDIGVTPQTHIESGIAVGDTVSVEGVVLETGVLQASRITKVAADTGLPFEFTGLVQEKGDPHWVISSVTISVDAHTTIGKSVDVGTIVRVAGRIQKDGSWLAQEIKLAAKEERRFEFTGAIQSMAPWKVAGISFETRSWSHIDAGLKVGDQVRVEGTIQADGTWVAAEIMLVANFAEPHLIFIGVVISKDPWIVGGLAFKTTAETIIGADITPGMLVWVEAKLLSDGTWQAIRIQPVKTTLIWFPGCFKVNAVLISLKGKQIQFADWPLVVLVICFGKSMTLEIISITLITPIPSTPEETGTDRVLICHKPDQKKGGKTMSLPRAALQGHLGHGDTLGPCP